MLLFRLPLNAEPFKTHDGGYRNPPYEDMGRVGECQPSLPERMILTVKPLKSLRQRAKISFLFTPLLSSLDRDNLTRYNT